MHENYDYNLLRNEEVKHKFFGMGIINEIKDNVLTVNFNNGLQKSFEFPLCFDNEYLILTKVNFKNEAKNVVKTPLNKEQLSNYRNYKNKIRNNTFENKLLFNVFFDFMNDEFILRELKSDVIELLKKSKGQSYDTFSDNDRKLTIVYLSILAYRNYDGKFWPYVREDLKSLYNYYNNDQRLESTIRELVSDQDKLDDTRHITNVLVHAGIPIKFLKNFLDFAFDIYKINFNYQLQGLPIDEILMNTLDGLVDLLLSKNVVEDEISLNVSRKTYTLIKSTKLAIIHYRKDMATIISKILQMIEEWYHGDTLSEEYPEEYIKEFNEWVQENQIIKTDSRASSTREYVRSPIFKQDINHNCIYIQFPLITLKNIKEEELEKVEIVLNAHHEEKQLLLNEHFKIIEKIGYFIVEMFPLKVSNPLDSINLIIKKENTIVYDSLETLNRNYILFDKLGNEINNKEYYDELVTLIHNENEVSFASTSSYENYNISIFIANPNLMYQVGNNIICFNSHVHEGLYGEEILNTICIKDNKKLTVYKSVNFFIFNSSTKIDELIFSINKRHYKLSDDNCEVFKDNGIYKYRIKLNKFNLNSHEITLRVSNIDSQECKEGPFILDKGFVDLELNTDKLLIVENNIKSDFNINIDENSDMDLILNASLKNSFNLGFNKYTYITDPKVIRYKWKESDNWSLLDDIDLIHYEIFLSAKIQEVLIYIKDQERSIGKLPFENINYNVVKINLSYLRQYSNNNDYITLGIINTEGKEYFHRVYLRPTILGDPKIKMNDEKEIKIILNIRKFKSNKLTYMLCRENSCMSGELLTNEIIMKSFEPYVSYQLKITEKGDIFTIGNERLLYSDELIIYDTGLLAGRRYKIDSLQYFDNGIEKESYIKPTLIKFIKKITNNDIFSKSNTLSLVNHCYECEFFILTYQNKIKPFNSDQKIYAEVVSNRKNPLITLYLEYEDGEGLGFIKSRKFIEQRYDNNNIPIDHIIIDTRKGEV